VHEGATRNRSALVLSAVEFDVVWRGLGLGAPPVVLQLPSPGRTHADRRRIEVEVWATLRARGLGPCSDLTHLLGGLAAPSPRVEVRAWGASTTRAVVAASRSDGGVLARLRDATVVVEPCCSVAGAVTDLLTGGRPGPGRAASVPGAELDEALRRPSGAGLRADLVTLGVDPAEAGLLARMLHAVTGRAQITVAVPDRWGAVRRSGDLLEVLDGTTGRYLMTRTRGGDGTCWTTVAPVDDRRLRHRVVELLSPGRRAASAVGPLR
jgi:EspG family